MAAISEEEYLLLPVCFVFLFIFDEIVFRRSPQAGVLLCFILLLITPFTQILSGIETTVTGTLFLLIRCYTIIIPVFIICLFRLAYATINAERGSKRRRECKRMYKWFGKCFIKKLTNKNNFISDKWYNYFSIIIYISFGLNLFEIAVYEIMEGNVYDPRYDWSRYCNVFALLCLIITFPSPWSNVNKQYCYNNLLDTRKESKYTDMIIDIIGRDIKRIENKEIRKNIWLDIMTIIWMTLITSTNWEAIVRVYGYTAALWTMPYMVQIFIRSLLYSRPLGSIYIQSMLQSNLVFTMIIRVILNGIISVEINNNNNKNVATGIGLMIVSVINGFIAIVFTIILFIINIERRQKIYETENAKHIAEIAKMKCAEDMVKSAVGMIDVNKVAKVAKVIQLANAVEVDKVEKDENEDEDVEQVAVVAVVNENVNV